MSATTRSTVQMISTALLVGCLSALALAGEKQPLVVHEWGTFTELQSHAGTSIGGINTDDEPVPDFVHKLGEAILEPTIEPWRRRALFGKSLRHLQNVTMRLETPVIYFYPPADLQKPLQVTVDVQLRGGWLTEFYPNASANAPGLRRRQLGRHAAGTLQWSNLQIASAAPNGPAADNLPQTNEHVWITPRKTHASVVTTPAGESEKYLFYRGVGNFGGPLQVVTDVDQNQLTLKSRFHTVGAQTPMSVPAAWLVSVLPGGEVAFRAINSFEVPNDRPEVIGTVDRDFSQADHSPGNLELLKHQMHAELVADGLFDDEATAMLSTWEHAYFRSPGLRLFYLLPRDWTDDRMPLTLTMPAEITRVMMGRIELISDRQRELISQVSAEPVAEKYWTSTLPKSPATTEFWQGANNLDELVKLGVKIPDAYRGYIELGRFRNALLRHEVLQSGNASLLQFLSKTGLMTDEITSQLVKTKPKVKTNQTAGS